MQLDKYQYQANENFETFTFNSIGPKGNIKKIINFQLVNWRIANLRVVNLAFGDWNEKTQKVDDSVISNNGDRDKVLATVASTILTYTEKSGPIAVFAIGITPIKTRLYQMGINAHLIQIKQLFIVYGLLNGQWVTLNRDRTMERF